MIKADENQMEGRHPMGAIQSKVESDLIRVNRCCQEQRLYVHIRPDSAARGRGYAAED
jgi:hypothetical protein